MRDHERHLSFAPRLPQGLARLAFGMCFRERRLRVKVTHGHARYPLTQGAPPQITHHGEAIEIAATRAVIRAIPDLAVGEAAATRRLDARSATRPR